MPVAGSFTGSFTVPKGQEKADCPGLELGRETSPVHPTLSTSSALAPGFPSGASVKADSIRAREMPAQGEFPGSTPRCRGKGKKKKN
jgi:hypothetical protein